MEYKGSKPIGVKKIVVSTQHVENCSQKHLKEFVIDVVKKVLPKKWSYNYDDILVNPTGRFVIGGPDGDTGLTGRKIIVDTYGGSAQHGGGAFSGKDPTKVDRSAAYMTRYLAKNVVASKLASKCSIQIAYAIGVSQPLSLYVNTFDTGKVDDQVIQECIRKNVDLSTLYDIETLRQVASRKLTKNNFKLILQNYKIEKEVGEFQGDWDPDEIKTLQQLKSELCKTGNNFWGDHIIIQLLSQALKKNIIVLNGDEDFEKLSYNTVETSGSKGYIIIYFENNCHYKLVGKFNGKKIVTVFNKIPEILLNLEN